MPSTYSNLKIQLMATGENNNTWGDITNLNLGTAIDEAIGGSAVVTFANADVTLPWTDSNASQTARNLRLSLTGSATAGYALIVPSIEKSYIINNGTDGAITVKNSGGVGVVVPTGKTMWVYNNSTNVVDVVSHLTSLTLGTALPVTSGGTGGNSGSTARASLNVPGLASDNTFTGSQTINQSAASAALYVTQAGAGPAVQVDEGTAFFGGSTTYSMGLVPKVQLSSTTGGASTINAITWNASSSAQYAFGRSRSAVAGVYTAVQAGDDLGIISFYGTDGTGFDRGAYIAGIADGTPTTGNVPARIAFYTGTNAAAPAERMRISSGGFVGINTVSPTQALSVGGGVGYNAPVTVAAGTYTVGITDNWIIANNAGTVTLTLPAAASFSGRILTIKNVQAQLVVSASSNVVPIGSTTAGTAILAATAGKFATVVSDGTNWVVMQAN